MEDTGNNTSNNRVWLFVITVVCLLAAVFFVQAKTEYNYKATAAEHLTLVVDSIDFRQDLTRIYGRILGRPHTSQRIDELELDINGDKMRATDIDGVDFKRWFQWEDDGIIPVEIDFPAMSQFNGASLKITTPRGIDHCSVSRLNDSK